MGLSFGYTRCAFKAPVLGDTFWDAISQLQTQERRFGGGGFWLLPTQVKVAPSCGKVLWFIRFFYRFWIAMAGQVFYIASMMTLYLLHDDVPAMYAVSALFVGIPVIMINPILEYWLTARWSEIHGQKPLPLTKVLIRLVTMPFYTVLMIVVEWIILFDVAWSGAAGQEYKPRAKKANIDEKLISPVATPEMSRNTSRDNLLALDSQSGIAQAGVAAYELEVNTLRIELVDLEANEKRM